MDIPGFINVPPYPAWHTKSLLRRWPLRKAPTPRSVLAAGTSASNIAARTLETTRSSKPRRAELIGRQLAITILVERLERLAGLGDLFGFDRAVLVQIEGLDDRHHWALPAHATLVARRSHLSKGTARPPHARLWTTRTTHPCIATDGPAFLHRRPHLLHVLQLIGRQDFLHLRLYLRLQLRYLLPLLRGQVQLFRHWGRQKLRAAAFTARTWATSFGARRTLALGRWIAFLRCEKAS
jgi:hypothetical protein